MATYSMLPFGTWRVQVRRKGRYISETFLERDDARRRAEAEGRTSGRFGLIVKVNIVRQHSAYAFAVTWPKLVAWAY